MGQSFLTRYQKLVPSGVSSLSMSLIQELWVGMPMSLAIHDLGLSTVIGRDRKDFSGKPIIDASMQSIIERISTWDYRTQTRDSQDRNK